MISSLSEFLFSSGIGVVKIWTVGWMPAFINQVFLGHSCAHLFMYYLWLLSCYSEGQNCNKDPTAHRSPNVHCPAIYRKKYAALCYHQSAQFQNTSLRPKEKPLANLKTKANGLHFECNSDNDEEPTSSPCIWLNLPSASTNPVWPLSFDYLVIKLGMYHYCLSKALNSSTIITEITNQRHHTHDTLSGDQDRSSTRAGLLAPFTVDFSGL